MHEGKLLINWYPGHMTKGLREINENASLADLFIIVLDARCPISSYNEDFDKIAPHKPRLFVVTKSDLMDTNKKDKIIKRFGSSSILWLDLRQNKSRNIILNKIKTLTKEKQKRDLEKGFLISRTKVFVLGVPNAGKSTLINLMQNKKTLKVANFPGVTRAKTWVNVNNELFFMDTPGILLPNFKDQDAAVKLAMVGSIETKIFPPKFIAQNFLSKLLEYYPEKIMSEFHVDELPETNDEISMFKLINDIAKANNFKNGSQVDLDKTYDFVINTTHRMKGVTYD